MRKEPHETTEVIKLNKYLKEEFKVTVNPESTTGELKCLKENMIDRLSYLEFEKGANATDAEYAKCMVMLEVANLMISGRELIEEHAAVDAKRNLLVRMLANNAMYYITNGDDYASAIHSVMRDYRGSKALWLDHEIEMDVKDILDFELADERLAGDIDPDFTKRVGEIEEIEEAGDYYDPTTDFGVTPSAGGKKDNGGRGHGYAGVDRAPIKKKSMQAMNRDAKASRAKSSNDKHNYGTPSKMTDNEREMKNKAAPFTKYGTATKKPKDKGMVIGSDGIPIVTPKQTRIKMADSVSYNKKTMKGNVPVRIFSESGASNARIRFMITESGEIKIVDIIDANGSFITETISSTESKTLIKEDILTKLIAEELV